MSERFNLESRVDDNDPQAVFEAEMNILIETSRDFDSGEISQMRRMMEEVKEGKMTREDALAKARALKGAKSDYH